MPPVSKSCVNGETVRYFQQGTHDGLCGFYAVLNAFRYVQQQSGHDYLRDDDAAFFDEAVECLARVPGVDIRIMKNDNAFGGIDQFQIRDLCKIFSERVDLDVAVNMITGRQSIPFRRRYRMLLKHQKMFALIVAYRDGSHWVAVAPSHHDGYLLLDDGTFRETQFGHQDAPVLARNASVLLTAA